MKNTKQNRNGKDNKFFIILYPDSTTYEYLQVIERIKALSLKYAYILHDMDTTEDGEIKKAHIHVYFKTENQVSIPSVAAKLEMPQNDIQFAVTERGCIRYLMHLDNSEKRLYPVDNIISDFDFSKYLVDREKDTFFAVSELYTYIKNYKVHTFQDLVDYCLLNNRPDLLKVVMNKAYFFRQLLNEIKV